MQPIPPGMGFYQPEDNTLRVPIGNYDQSKKFFSYVDSPISRFDIDKQGRLVFVELTLPKYRWVVAELPPVSINKYPIEVAWVDFRKDIDSPAVLTDKNRTRMLIRLSNDLPVLNSPLAEFVSLQVSESGNACGILIDAIVDDIAGRRLAGFRRDLRTIAASASQSASTLNPSPTVS